MLPQILSSQVEAVGRVFLARRPLVVGPLAAWTVGVLFFTDAPVAQRTIALGAMSVGFSFFLVEAWLARRRPISQRWLFGSLLVTLLLVSGAVAVLGGLSGPFIPMLFAPAGVGFAAFGSSGRGFTLWGVMTVVLLLLLLQPLGVPFAPLGPTAHRLIALGAASASVLLLLLGVGGLSVAYVRASERVVSASDEVVAAAQARARAVEELSGHFAHELKNPLGALRGVVELVAESANDERTKRRLEVAQSELARMETVLRDGLDFTRPVSPAKRAPCDVAALMTGVVNVLEAQAQRQGVRVVAEGPSLTESLDAELLKAALLNLSLNALQATPAGGTVRLSWRADAEALRLEVQDTGRGMDAATLARVGQPFFTTRAGGTGLGVALARQVASQHGGRLTFVSVEGQGTTATMSLQRGGVA